MNTPHKHAEIIKAWDDGAEIQMYSEKNRGWADVYFPDWSTENLYRVKPKFLVHQTRIEPHPEKNPFGVIFNYGPANIELTFNADTRELESAKVLK